MKGSWVQYNGESLVQGKDNLVPFLESNPTLFKNIKDEVEADLNKFLEESNKK